MPPHANGTPKCPLMLTGLSNVPSQFGLQNASHFIKKNSKLQNVITFIHEGGFKNRKKCQKEDNELYNMM